MLLKKNSIFFTSMLERYRQKELVGRHVIYMWVCFYTICIGSLMTQVLRDEK